MKSHSLDEKETDWMDDFILFIHPFHVCLPRFQRFDISFPHCITFILTTNLVSMSCSLWCNLDSCLESGWGSIFVRPVEQASEGGNETLTFPTAPSPTTTHLIVCIYESTWLSILLSVPGFFDLVRREKREGSLLFEVVGGVVRGEMLQEVNPRAATSHRPPTFKQRTIHKKCLQDLSTSLCYLVSIVSNHLLHNSLFIERSWLLSDVPISTEPLFDWPRYTLGSGGSYDIADCEKRRTKRSEKGDGSVPVTLQRTWKSSKVKIEAVVSLWLTRCSPF